MEQLVKGGGRGDPSLYDWPSCASLCSEKYRTFSSLIHDLTKQLLREQAPSSLEEI